MSNLRYSISYLLLMAVLLKFWPPRLVLYLLPIRAHLTRVQAEIQILILKGMEAGRKAEAEASAAQLGVPEGFEAPTHDDESSPEIPEEPLPDDKLIELIEESATGALYLDRPYPPPHGESLSWFGGLPTLPDEMEWPIYVPDPKPDWRTNEPVPMHFLAQIDCAEFPDFEGRELLPESGILFFFAQTDWSNYDPPDVWKTFNVSRVLFHDGDTENLKARPVPEGIPPCYRTEVEHHYAWFDGKEPADELPCTFRKWPIEMKPFRSYADTHFTGNLAYEVSVQYDTLWRSMQEEALTEALGELTHYELPESYFDNELQLPDDGFPYAWIGVDVFARIVRKDISDSYSGPRNVIFDGEEVDSDEAGKSEYIEQIVGEATDWIAKAKATPYEAVPENSRQDFLDWIVRLTKPDASAPYHLRARDMNSNIWLKSRNEIISACLTHSAQSAALIPAETVEAARPEQTAFATVYRRDYKRHQLFGSPASAQDAHWRTGKEVLLLQLDSDDRMNWMWGDLGTLQFWIKLDDLAARRFDRACGHLDAT